MTGWTGRVMLMMVEMAGERRMTVEMVGERRTGLGGECERGWRGRWELMRGRW